MEKWEENQETKAESLDMSLDQERDGCERRNVRIPRLGME